MFTTLYPVYQDVRLKWLLFNCTAVSKILIVPTALIALNYSQATVFISLNIRVSHIIKNIFFDLFCCCDHLL